MEENNNNLTPDDKNKQKSLLKLIRTGYMER